MSSAVADYESVLFLWFKASLMYFDQLSNLFLEISFRGLWPSLGELASFNLDIFSVFR